MTDDDQEATPEQRKLLGLGDTAAFPGAGAAFTEGPTAFRQMMDASHDADVIQGGMDSRRQQPRQRGTPAPSDGGA